MRLMTRISLKEGGDKYVFTPEMLRFAVKRIERCRDEDKTYICRGFIAEANPVPIAPRQTWQTLHVDVRDIVAVKEDEVLW